MGRLTDAAVTYAPLAILALLWEAASRSGLISQYALPPLTAIAVAWWGLLGDPDYYRHVGMSLWRGATGLGAATLLGIVMGTLMAWFRPINALVGPIVQMFYPMPKSALIPLTIMWFGIGHLSKVFLIFLGCLLPMVISTFNGVRGVERSLVWSAASLGAGRWTIMRDVAFMAAVPDILAGMRAALALSFVLLISSELLISSNGLGYLIRLLGDGSQYAAMFAVILTVVTLGFISDRLFQAASRRILRWRP